MSGRYWAGIENMAGVGKKKPSTEAPEECIVLIIAFYARNVVFVINSKKISTNNNQMYQ